MKYAFDILECGREWDEIHFANVIQFISSAKLWYSYVCCIQFLFNFPIYCKIEIAKYGIIINIYQFVAGKAFVVDDYVCSVEESMMMCIERQINMWCLMRMLMNIESPSIFSYLSIRRLELIIRRFVDNSVDSKFRKISKQNEHLISFKI